MAGRGRGRGRGGGSLLDAALARFDDGDRKPPPSAKHSDGPAPMAPGERGGGEKDFRGPAGLFTKGDWECPACGNINWARRPVCNMCNHQKPSVAGPEEQRDGVGGGFNERQDRVSSLQVEVTEDGFDDFGRKAKQKALDKAAKEQAALARLAASYNGMSSGIVMSGANEDHKPSSKSSPRRSRSVSGDRRRDRSNSRDRDRHGRRGGSRERRGSRDYDSRRDNRDRYESRRDDRYDKRNRSDGGGRRRSSSRERGRRVRDRSRS